MPDPAVSSDASLGQYRLVRQLGRGGMGIVWLAFDPVLQRHVAIKELRPAAETSPALAKRFLREAQAIARLNHPNIVTIYQILQEPARTSIVMEYVDGGSLADFLARFGALPWRHAVQAALDAAAGLEAAHEEGIIHRDIKPANLIRTRRDTVKIVDFGLARWAQDSELTVHGSFVGSPAFASPEHADPRAKLDARSDLYSLTATLFSLLTRRPPFGGEGEETHEILRRQREEPFPDPRKVVPDLPIPDGLLRVLAKGSAKRPADRYQSAAEMAGDLAALLGAPERSHTFGAAWPKSSVRTSPASACGASVAQLEHQLAESRHAHDAARELSTLQALFHAYSRAGEAERAREAARQGLVTWVRMRGREVVRASGPH